MRALLFALLLPLSVWGYEYELSVVLLFQNEARFLKEWLEYHKLVGVQHFFLYNNLSDDDYLEVLEPYLASGEVELVDVPILTLNQPDNLKVQCDVYNRAIQAAKGRTKWLALIDADEYLVPLEHNTVTELLREYEPYGGLHANWLNFGTSGIERIPDDKLRIEALLRCNIVSENLGKSIVRPERVEKSTDPHVYLYLPPYYHVNTNFERFGWLSVQSGTRKRLMIYHYYTGDLDHLINTKFPRRVLWYPYLQLESYLKHVEIYNRRVNKTMLRFVPQVRKAVFGE